ncbi:glycine/D-amino acid oxidase-like deaminating enzyme [Hoeflea marina]|uniref:Glycine/D-amino acid oxidase-like deaminating enzyme n=1 Tax=Hoeflea marina TaxID=274592 RepID=A0A317PEG2_9HYPH|nr:FAD-binding oxidoreductase [Hoeflea marina]PWV97800.1 glycine/D-amino acid oxidase-like deaminating enzyme [Hoeflea marina]
MTDKSETPGDPSWWLTEALQAEGNPLPASALSGSVTTDVAIVGGGFTGLWTALAIKQRAPDTRIVLIEAAICGAGASGKNGGKVHGYWASLPGMADSIGPDSALAVARAGTRAQDGIREFATAPGRDIWWREDGNVRVSAAPAQDKKIARYVETAQALGVPDTAQPLSAAEVASYCRSPAFRSGLYLPEGANVQPARLARALRRAALDLGVTIHENTPMTALETGTPNRVRTPAGEIIAREVILATNTALAADSDIKPFVTVFSSYALMTEPAPEALEEMGWRGNVGMADLRMFVHYFRKTVDGRVLMGSGSGPISFNGDATAPSLTGDLASGQRAVRALRRLLPGLASTGVAKVWGGGIDVSSDRLPFFRTRPGTRVHYASGYSGHGVNPTYIGGQCLASLALGHKDEWTSLPLCTRELPRFPPEPFRTIGGRLVRRGIMACEEAEERESIAPWPMRAAAAIPKVFGLRIGTR